MSTPSEVAAAVNGNADAKSLARLLVLQKAILDILKDADAETRDQAKAIFEQGDAASVMTGETQLGRVRRDKPTRRGSVVDWSAFEAWCVEHVPQAFCQLSKGWIAALTKTGEWLDETTGEVMQVAGVGFTESPGNLVVTTTEAAEDWARTVVSRDIRGELE